MKNKKKAELIRLIPLAHKHWFEEQTVSIDNLDLSDAKNQIQNAYIAIAFRNSKEGQSLIKTLLDTIKN